VLAKAGNDYFKGQDEEAVPLRERAQEIAKETIKSALPKGGKD
jgi:hypothetical protein